MTVNETMALRRAILARDAAEREIRILRARQRAERRPRLPYGDGETRDGFEIPDTRPMV